MTTTSLGPIGTIGSTTSTSSTGATTGTSSTTGSNAIDQDMFLKLLVAQLKNQDPSSPTDPSQFLSQTAQFSTVEKLTSLADLTQKVYDASRQQSAASMIGRSVTYTDVSGATRTGMVTGVSVGASTPNLTIGGLQISLDNVSAVATSSTPSGASSSGASSSGASSSGA
jgi:flagellar basal-body rod modification protein FlgD